MQFLSFGAQGVHGSEPWLELGWRGSFMTRDEVIRLAREAGMQGMLTDVVTTFDEIERFAALVAAHEREACANVAEKTVCDTHLPTGVKIYGSRAAAAILARGNDGQE